LVDKVYQLTNLRAAWDKVRAMWGAQLRFGLVRTRNVGWLASEKGGESKRDLATFAGGLLRSRRPDFNGKRRTKIEKHQDRSEQTFV
jgi:hypothetical protein